MTRITDECNYYRDDEDGIFCDCRGEVCRFKYRKRCKNFISVLDYQIACDKRQGTNFAKALYGVEEGKDGE